MFTEDGASVADEPRSGGPPTSSELRQGQQHHTILLCIVATSAMFVRN